MKQETLEDRLRTAMPEATPAQIRTLANHLRAYAERAARGDTQAFAAATRLVEGLPMRITPQGHHIRLFTEAHGEFSIL